MMSLISRAALCMACLSIACAEGGTESFQPDAPAQRPDLKRIPLDFGQWPDSSFEGVTGHVGSRDGAGLGDAPTVMDDLGGDLPQDGPQPSDGPAQDLPGTFLLPDLPTTGPTVGTPCTTSADCGGGTSCILSVGGKGMCTIRCTADNHATTRVEDTCPDLTQNICGKVATNTGDAFFCLRRCTPQSAGNTCFAPFSCRYAAGGITDREGVGVCLYTACKGPQDCPVFTGKTCVLSSGAGCSSAKGEFCVNRSAGPRCAVGGVCNLRSGMCEGHDKGLPGVKVGDPCSSDVACGDNMYCVQEGLDGGRTRWRNGYCTVFGCNFASTVKAFGCPAGSHCNRAFFASNGFCQKACVASQPLTCRGHGADRLGDYECYAWDRVSYDGRPISTGSVCDTTISCDLLSGGCPAVGTPNNTTSMSCRSLSNRRMLYSLDPAGLCLDSTASGPTL